MSDDSPRDGLKTVLEGMKPTETPPPEPRAEQLALLGEPGNDVTAAAAQAQEDSAGGITALINGPKRPGRPKGSRNRRTEQWADYILASFPSPLVFLARIINMPTLKVAAKYRISMGDAIKLQVQAAKELAPYLHQKKPLALQGEGLAPINLIIGNIDGGELGTDEDGGLTLNAVDVTDKQDSEG